MKSTSKWYLLPPALAALLILGPMSMQSGSGTPAATKTAEATEGSTSAPPADDGARPQRSIIVPKSPDLLQMCSALGGVLLLGVGGLFVLRRLRRGASPTRGSNLVTLRQTLRLSARQAVHAIEFDDRILLIGEHERGLSMLDSGRLPERTNDEQHVLARATASPPDEDHDDEGAVPKNLVIPRPARPPARTLPRPQSAPANTPRTALGDFRSLLQKAGRA